MYVFEKCSAGGTTNVWRCDQGKVECKGCMWTNTTNGSFHYLTVAHTCSNTGDATHVAYQEILTL